MNHQQAPKDEPMLRTRPELQRHQRGDSIHDPGAPPVLAITAASLGLWAVIIAIAVALLSAVQGGTTP